MESANLLKYLRVSLTTACDKHCWYCFREGILQDKVMMTDLESYEWLIQLLKGYYGLTNVRFTGGEPMMNPLIVNFVAITNKVGISNIGVTTNGYELNSHFVDLCDAGVNSFAIHYTDIDNEDWNITCNLFDLILDKRVRYNAVVTRINYEKILDLIKYFNSKGINLLLLDLLDTNALGYKHSELYFPMEQLGDILSSKGYKKNIQNINCLVYYNNNHSIKLVSRYTQDISKVYCTCGLDMHPVLLTSDFNFRLCNHFGTIEIPANKEIVEKNRMGTIKIIDYVLSELKQCNECHNKIVVCD